jgi:hypothetical protein
MSYEEDEGTTDWLLQSSILIPRKVSNTTASVMESPHVGDVRMMEWYVLLQEERWLSSNNYQKGAGAAHNYKCQI